MRLADFKQADRRRFVAPISSTTGDSDYEMILTGPPKLVRRMFERSEVEVTIDPSGAGGRWAAECQQMYERQFEASVSMASLEHVEELLKPAPLDPDKESTVFAALHPTHAEGTPFFISLLNFVVPAGTNLFIVGRPVRVAAAVVMPKSGDQDLFLWAFPPGFPVSTSTKGGTSADVVSFFIPPFLPPEFQFVPVFRILGFSTGTCAAFTAFGG